MINCDLFVYLIHFTIHNDNLYANSRVITEGYAILHRNDYVVAGYAKHESNWFNLRRLISWQIKITNVQDPCRWFFILGFFPILIQSQQIVSIEKDKNNYISKI